MAWLLKTIHQTYYLQYHVGTDFFLTYHCTEGSVHLFMNETKDKLNDSARILVIYFKFHKQGTTLHNEKHLH